MSPDRSRSRPPRAGAAAPLAAAFFCCALAAGALALKAAWIPLKAELAQQLLQRSWGAIQEGRHDARPWPWADTRPAAILRVPRLGIRQFALEGQSGRNLAFGPVFLDATAPRPGGTAGSDRILSGHRDTHFRFLERLQPGDRIELETRWGAETYVVAEMDVVDSRTAELVVEPAVRRLSLVTCYPFDATAPGGPLRLVVTALPPGPQTPVSSRRRSASSG